MSARLVPVHLNLHAARTIRLADIPTGSAGLLAEHKAWLDETILQLKNREHYWIDIVGYASKLRKRGEHDEQRSRQYNRDLSYQRAAEVAFYLEQLDPSIQEHIREFAAHGNEDYVAPPTDDAGEERAVEVHVTFAAVPPVPPPQLERKKPLPGGPRCTKWAVAAPAGLTFSPIPWIPGAIAGNLLAFRCCEGKGATHVYVSPGAGPGASYSGPPIDSKKISAIRTAISTASYSGWSFTHATAITPFNFNDLEGATARVVSAGAGYGAGYLGALVSVGGKTYYRNKFGELLYGYQDFLSNVNVSGEDYQLGVGASAVGGPLIKIR